MHIYIYIYILNIYGMEGGPARAHALKCMICKYTDLNNV